MRRKEIPCVLCEKENTFSDSGVCSNCTRLWRLGGKRSELAAAESRRVLVRVNWYPQMQNYNGDVEGSVEVHWTDIAAAMGAISTRDIAHHKEKPITIGQAEGRYDSNTSLETLEVPESRAVAMKKIIAAFFNGVAKAKAEGVNKGRNLLAGLASGELTTKEFDEVSEAARTQKHRKS